MKLQLSIRATNLKNVAGAFKGISDPFAIVTRLSTNVSEKPVVLGKTEVVKNSLSPDWVKVFILDYELGTPQKVAINVFDEVKKRKNIDMGSAVFDVGEILGARGNTVAKKLKKGGSLVATVQKCEGTGTFQFHFAGQNLTNKEGMFSKSDPFLVLSRKVKNISGQTWDNVYRSDYIKKNLDPEWKEDSVELSVLCGGDLDAPINLAVYDYERNGKHVLMGSIETTVKNLLDIGSKGPNATMGLWIAGKSTGTLIIKKAQVSGITATGVPIEKMGAISMNQVPVVAGTVVTSDTVEGVARGIIVPLAPPTASSSSLATSATSAGVAVGAVVPMAPSEAPQPLGRRSSSKELFVDYISGGCELNVVVAIDFTGSNGDPRKPGTLHHVDPKLRNPYEKAISAIVSILMQYDSDKKIPVLGFGAKYDGVVNHCFQCGPSQEADGLQGVMDAYKVVFKSGLILSRPTVFNEVLRSAADRAERSQAAAMSKGGQSYTILLIVTDGAVSDVNSTAECLASICNSPLSVVIVGVGDADFKAMEFLGNSAAKSGHRDIAQFVAFNQHSESSHSLTKATLEEIPRQLVEYFQSQEIPPLPPIMQDHDSLAKLMDNGDAAEEIDLNLHLDEENIVVTGGGMAVVDGFIAR